MLSKKLKQHEAVILAMEKLGGKALLSQLFQEVFTIENCDWKTKTPFESIRRIVQTRPEVIKITPGLYALASRQKELEKEGILQSTRQNQESPAVADFNHYFYQGLLLQIGKSHHLETFVPHQDKNKRFLNQSLGELRTLGELPAFGYPHFLRYGATVDVMWFNDRAMPDSFFEVEHSTDFERSFIKFVELQDFNAQMFIVADEKRRALFEEKNAQVAFRPIKPRVEFRSYDDVVRDFEYLTRQQIESKRDGEKPILP